MNHINELVAAYAAMDTLARGQLRALAVLWARDFPAPKKTGCLSVVPDTGLNLAGKNFNQAVDLPSATVIAHPIHRQ